MSSLVSSLPPPTMKSKWDDDEDLPEPPQTTSRIHKIPPYLHRKGFIPKTPLDFADGGAFPEIHIPQYPLNMGKSSSSTSNTLALQADSTGELRYDAVTQQKVSGKSIVHSQIQSLQEKEVGEYAKPTPEEIEEITQKTKKAIEKVTTHMVSLVRGTQSTFKSSIDQDPEFIRYTPVTGSSTDTKIIRMVSAPVDPLEPPRFKTKKVPRAPGSPPPPVLHSPPRKISAEEQKQWVVPPCISNWKNPKGYTIPLDKRLAADGRGVQQVTLNDNFAKLGEALAIADRHAREEVRVRAEMQAKIAQKTKKDKEEKLRMLAQRAREERGGTGTLTTAPTPDFQSREDLRRDRARIREQEIRSDRRPIDRDVSEKIALGITQPTVSKDSMYDSRLFNQSSGIGSGWTHTDAYNIYDKPLFNGSSANAMYRPKKVMDELNQVVSGVRSDHIEEIVDGAMTKAPYKGFQGTEGSGGREGPVQFEKDVFGIDEFLETAKRGRDG